MRVIHMDSPIYTNQKIFDTIRIDSYRSTLNRVNNENQKLKKENERLYALNK